MKIATLSATINAGDYVQFNCRTHVPAARRDAMGFTLGIGSSRKEEKLNAQRHRGAGVSGASSKP
ncbi:MAG: hypothetical protein ACREB8_05105 [Pseudolabrys sp.]